MHLRFWWPGTEVKGVRERDENKTGSDRRIFFFRVDDYICGNTPATRERRRIWAAVTLTSILLTLTARMWPTRRASERASARGLELQKSQVMQRWKSAAHYRSWGRRGSRVLRLNHEIANNPLNSFWRCDVVFRMPTCNWRILV